MKILDPNLKDGVHEWRDGKKLVKEGFKLYLEGTTTLAGSIVALDTCIRNFVKFTGCSLGEAIKCATFNPARYFFPPIPSWSCAERNYKGVWESRTGREHLGRVPMRISPCSMRTGTW